MEKADITDKNGSTSYLYRQNDASVNNLTAIC